MQLIVRQRSLSHCPISSDKNGSWGRCLAFTTAYLLPEPGSKDRRIYKDPPWNCENLVIRHLQVLCSRSSWCQLNGFNSWLLARMHHRHSYVSVVVQAGKGADPRDKWRHIWLDCFLTVVTIITQMGNYSPQWFAAESALRFDLQAFCWWRHVLKTEDWPDFALRRYWKRLNSQPCPGSNHSMVRTSCFLNPCGWDWSSSCWTWGVTVLFVCCKLSTWWVVKSFRWASRPAWKKMRDAENPHWWEPWCCVVGLQGLHS